MKKQLKILLLFLPLILMEIFLRIDNNFYRSVLLVNSSYVEWRQAAPKVNYWPNTLIFGTSVGRQSIDPQSLQSEYLKSTGNIAINASSTSNDYLTLKRILATCIKCPKTIVYQVTDLSLKEQEIWLWEHSTFQRILLLYFPDPEIDSILKKAAQINPQFDQYLVSLKAASFLRTPFLSGKLLNLLLSRGTIYEPLYKDEELITYTYRETINDEIKKRSLSYASNELDKYKIGGTSVLFFKEFVSLAKRNNIEIILVLTPQNVLYRETFSKEFKLFEDWINAFAKETNTSLVDDRKYQEGNNNYFYDLTHLNAKGAPIYSRKLGKKLRYY